MASFILVIRSSSAEPSRINHRKDWLIRRRKPQCAASYNDLHSFTEFEFKACADPENSVRGS